MLKADGMREAELKVFEYEKAGINAYLGSTPLR